MSPAWAATGAAGSLVTLFLALFLILAGFVLLAWFARRYLPGLAGQGVAKIVGNAQVGPRERVVVVEVGSRWLVLGVGGGQVRLLESLDAPNAEHATCDTQPD